MNTMRDIPASGNAHGRDCWAGTEPAWYRPAPRDLSTAPAHVVCAMHLRWVDAGRPVWPVFPEIPARECVAGAIPSPPPTSAGAAPVAPALLGRV